MDADLGPRGPLIVRTVRLDEAPDLIAALPVRDSVAWIRHGQGFVGWGRAHVIRPRGENRFLDATLAFHALSRRAIIRDEVGVPGSGLVAFGSFTFSERSAHSSLLVIPEVVIGVRDDTAWMTTVTASLSPAPGPHLLARRRPVAAPGPVSLAPGELTRSTWRDLVERMVGTIERGVADKVVLARDIVAASAEPLDPRALLARLAAQYPSCWTFNVGGLVGATPELLLRASKGLATSRVLAGTIRRTGDDSLDYGRAAQLAHSSKDLEEHEYAVRSVAEALTPFCSSLNVPESPYVMTLPNVMHLASDVTGVITDPALHTSLDLAGFLHPSAAVCGTPRYVAELLIEENEQMDRGRYSGPVGWIGAGGDGEWGIALRCAQLSDDRRRARLYAGGGIVAASRPDDEVRETEAKFIPMLQAIGALPMVKG